MFRISAAIALSLTATAFYDNQAMAVEKHWLAPPPSRTCQSAPATPFLNEPDTSATQHMFGTPVRGLLGEQLGVIHEVVVRPDGEVSAVIVGTGGLLGPAWWQGLVTPPSGEEVRPTTNRQTDG